MNIHSTFYCHLCLFISLFFGQITAQNTLHIQDGTFLNIQADTWVNIQGENDTSLVNQGTINNFGTLNLTNTNSIATWMQSSRFCGTSELCGRVSQSIQWLSNQTGTTSHTKSWIVYSNYSPKLSKNKRNQFMIFQFCMGTD